VQGGAETVAERLRRLREERLLTQVELAEKAGVSQWTISQIESARQKPRFSTLRRLADALEIEPRLLASGRES
jgi:transcriptional regulator with XRE-family HTH domain